MSYEQQLQEKQAYVRKNIGDYCKVLPIIGMENPYHYRNKVHAVFDVERRGKHANGGRRTAGNGHAKAAPGGVISGVYKAGTMRSSTLIPVRLRMSFQALSSVISEDFYIRLK